MSRCGYDLNTSALWYDIAILQWLIDLCKGNHVTVYVQNGEGEIGDGTRSKYDGFARSYIINENRAEPEHQLMQTKLQIIYLYE